MARLCPSCGTPIRRIRAVEVRPPKASKSNWYRYAPREFYCPKCKAQLRAAVTPVGRMILAMMAFVPLVAVFAAATNLLRLSDGASDWFLAALVLLAIPYSIWGTRLEAL
jgi:hypothetical protein